MIKNELMEEKNLKTDFNKQIVKAIVIAIVGFALISIKGMIEAFLQLSIILTPTKTIKITVAELQMIFWLMEIILIIIFAIWIIKMTKKYFFKVKIRITIIGYTLIVSVINIFQSALQFYKALKIYNGIEDKTLFLVALASIGPRKFFETLVIILLNVLIYLILISLFKNFAEKERERGIKISLLITIFSYFITEIIRILINHGIYDSFVKATLNLQNPAGFPISLNEILSTTILNVGYWGMIAMLVTICVIFVRNLKNEK